MPVPRMTTRRWMIAVIAVAILLALVTEHGRLSHISEHYAAQGRMHRTRKQAAERNRGLFEAAIPRRMQEAAWLEEALKGPLFNERDGELARERASKASEYVRAWRERERQFAAEARYHEALEAKYAQAARRPWFAVAPDPPPPE